MSGYLIFESAWDSCVKIVGEVTKQHRMVAFGCSQKGDKTRIKKLYILSIKKASNANK